MNNAEQLNDLQRQLSYLRTQQDQLLNLRLLDEVDADTFKRKSDELRGRSDGIKVKVEAAGQTW